jgi:hypothetical protein
MDLSGGCDKIGGEMAEIFISHIHEEAIPARGLRRYLEHHELDSFLSSENWQIKLGERWFDRIIQELDAAKIVILMLSPTSVSRPWINFEAGWAWAKGKITIPACFGGLDVGAMPRPYSDLQGVNLETDYSRLISHCRDHTGKFMLLPPTPFEQTDRFLKALKGTWVSQPIKFPGE